MKMLTGQQFDASNPFLAFSFVRARESIQSGREIVLLDHFILLYRRVRNLSFNLKEACLFPPFPN